MKVLLHLGFPKTGSSTLQYGLFKPLHDRGVLNLRTWRQEDPAEHMDRRPSSCLFVRRNILPEYLDFSAKKLNILSDESFTAPVKLRKNNYGADIEDPFSFPEKIRDQITARYGFEVEFIPFIVIRNQERLIFSQYVEEYNLKKYKDFDLIFDENEKIDITGFEIYRFFQYISTLESVFGAGTIRLFLFEEWTADLKQFCQRLSQILSVEAPTIERYLSASHVNKKTKSADGYYTKDGSALIPYLTGQQTRDIKEFYEADNAALAKFVDKKRLAEFGYI